MRCDESWDEFEAELRAAGLRESSVKTYVKGADAFVRWLDDAFEPRGPQSGKDARRP